VAREPAERPAPDQLELVRAFVNTWDIDKGTDDLADPAAAAAWFARAGLLDAATPLSGGDLAAIVRLREAFRAVLVANADSAAADAAVAVLNRAASDAKIVLRLSGPATSSPVVGAGGLNGAMGRLVAIAFEAIADGSWTRLKACPAERCHRAFYDSSRNRSSRWCDMEVCGNRAKRQTFRRRHRERL
jgi:predicted RNA-binding Zn ribbon-like protein